MTLYYKIWAIIVLCYIPFLFILGPVLDEIVFRYVAILYNIVNIFLFFNILRAFKTIRQKPSFWILFIIDILILLEATVVIIGALLRIS